MELCCRFPYQWNYFLQSTGQPHSHVRALPRTRDGAALNLCSPITALFNGRRRILKKFDTYFCPRFSGAHQRREFLFYGMGGSGKTQNALKFTKSCKQR
jgi:hypothetical protein